MNSTVGASVLAAILQSDILGKYGSDAEKPAAHRRQDGGQYSRRQQALPIPGRRPSAANNPGAR